jgi:hypothetical protein
LEEALVEFDLDEVVRSLDVVERDGGAGGDVPDVLCRTPAGKYGYPSLRARIRSVAARS